MALFRYKALSGAGEALDGQMEAASAEEVIVRLQDQGHLPVEARRADDEGGEGLSRLFRRETFGDSWRRCWAPASRSTARSASCSNCRKAPTRAA